MSPDAEHPAQLTDGHLVLAQDAARPRVIACHAYYRNTDCQERLAGARPAGSKSVKTVPSVMGTSGVGEAARAGATGLVGGADTGLTDTASASPATPTAAPGSVSRTSLAVHREHGGCPILDERRSGIGARDSFTAPASSQRTRIGLQLPSTCHLPL